MVDIWLFLGGVIEKVWLGYLHDVFMLKFQYVLLLLTLIHQSATDCPFQL